MTTIVVPTYFCPRCCKGVESALDCRPFARGRCRSLWPCCPSCGHAAELSAAAWLVAGTLVFFFHGLLLYAGSERDALCLAAPLWTVGVVRLIRHHGRCIIQRRRRC
jgi:hypothetical protein